MMTGRDEFANELLSAYLDGEVSSDERQQIEQQLAGSAEYRSELAALRALQSMLRELPRYRLPPEVGERTTGEIRRIAAGDAIVPPSFSLDPELLSAYCDGEVSEGERQVVERALTESAECRSPQGTAPAREQGGNAPSPPARRRRPRRSKSTTASQTCRSPLGLTRPFAPPAAGSSRQTGPTTPPP
jgi:anti-sigma factor RsiW